eukprot:3566838-Karenia_brevis.AAC.1
MGARRAVHEKQRLGVLNWMQDSVGEGARADDPNKLFDERLVEAVAWEQQGARSKMKPDVSGHVRAHPMHAVQPQGGIVD